MRWKQIEDEPKTFVLIFDTVRDTVHQIKLFDSAISRDVSSTNSFGITIHRETDHGGLVIPGGLSRSRHKCQYVRFGEPIWQKWSLPPDRISGKIS